MQCFGKQTATYAIYPHKGDWQDGDVYTQALQFNVGVTVMQTAAHKEGSIPAGSSLYSIDNGNVIMSAFKKAEDRDSLILRLFNPTDTTQSADISFLKDIKKAYICNLNEERQQEIPVNGNTIQLSLKKSKIITVEMMF